MGDVSGLWFSGMFGTSVAGGPGFKTKISRLLGWSGGRFVVHLVAKEKIKQKSNVASASAQDLQLYTVKQQHGDGYIHDKLAVQCS